MMPYMADVSLWWWIDILVGVIYTGVAAVTVVVLGLTGPLRAVLLLPFLLFFPGYAALVVLYPDTHASDVRERRPGHTMMAEYASAGIAPGARFLLAIIASAGLTPIIAVIVNFTPLPIRATTMTVAVGAVTVTLFVVGFLRRARVPPGDRGGIALGAVFDRIVGQFQVHSVTLLDDESARPTSGHEVVLNGFVALALLGVVTGAAFAYTAPTADQSFTEFYLVGQNGAGEYTIDAVPDTLPAGEQTTLYATITNQRGSEQEYHLIVERQLIDRTEGGITVTDSQRITTTSVTVDSGETVRPTHELGPLEAGTDYRVVYYLYRDSPPADPSRTTATTSLRLYVSGTDGGTG